MTKILVVEDDRDMQEDYKLGLERIVGNGNVMMVDNYADAQQYIGNSDIYIVDGNFPATKDTGAESLGPKLIKDLLKKNVPRSHIIFCSSSSDLQREVIIAKIQVYDKGQPFKEMFTYVEKLAKAGK